MKNTNQIKVKAEEKENFDLVQRIKDGKEELFSGDLYELAEQYGD